LALAHAAWAQCIREHLLTLLKGKGQSNVLSHFESLFVAVTIRMRPAQLCDWVAEIDGEKDDTLIGWYCKHQCGFEECLGPAAGRLLRNAEWTGELLAQLTSKMFIRGRQWRLPSGEGAGFCGYEVSALMAQVEQKAQARLGADQKSDVAVLAIGRVLSRADSADDKAVFLLNLYGRFIDDDEFDAASAKRLAYVAVQLQRRGEFDCADVVRTVQKLMSYEMRTLEWGDFMMDTPYSWSLSLLHTWMDATDLSSWSRRDLKPIFRGEWSLVSYVEGAIEFYWDDQEYPIFDTDAAVGLATSLGKLVAHFPFQHTIALIGLFQKREAAWREHVLSTGFHSDHRTTFPETALDYVYTVVFVEAWAAAASFPAAWSATECAKLAAKLSAWPRTMRDAASHLVLGWLMPHIDSSIGVAALGKALVD
jgi:hypothetical protein